MRGGLVALSLLAGAIGIAIGFGLRQSTILVDYVPREITGIVVDSRGKPIQDAIVELRKSIADVGSSHATDHETLTDSDGRYALPNLSECARASKFGSIGECRTIEVSSPVECGCEANPFLAQT